MMNVQRARIAIEIGLIASLLSFARLSVDVVGASDWSWVYWGARIMLAGGNPYVIAPDLLPYAKTLPLFYPLPAVLAAMPFAWLPEELAAAAFAGVSTALLAYGLERWQWWIFLSPAYLTALYNAQWSPLLTAALLLPALAPLAVCKPNLGAAVLLASPTRKAIIGAGLFGLLSLALRPSWPLDWMAALQIAHHRSPLILLPFGPLLLLALLRWRDKYARVFLALAVLPNALVFYDQLGLLTIPRSPRVLLLAIACQWGAISMAGVWWGASAPAWVIVGCYLPILAIVLHRRAQPVDIGIRDAARVAGAAKADVGHR